MEDDVEFVRLRRAGGSLTLTIPKALVRALGVKEGARLGVKVRKGQLIAEPAAEERPRYSLEELIAQGDPEAPASAEDEAWLTDAPRGGEQL